MQFEEISLTQEEKIEIQRKASAIGSFEFPLGADHFRLVSILLSLANKYPATYSFSPTEIVQYAKEATGVSIRLTKQLQDDLFNFFVFNRGTGSTPGHQVTRKAFVINKPWCERLQELGLKLTAVSGNNLRGVSALLPSVLWLAQQNDVPKSIQEVQLQFPLLAYRFVDMLAYMSANPRNNRRPMFYKLDYKHPETPTSGILLSLNDRGYAAAGILADIAEESFTYRRSPHLYRHFPNSEVRREMENSNEYIVTTPKEHKETVDYLKRAIIDGCVSRQDGAMEVVLDALANSKFFSTFVSSTRIWPTDAVALNIFPYLVAQAFDDPQKPSVGFLLVDCASNTNKGMVWIYVKPAHRRRGHAKRMWENMVSKYPILVDERYFEVYAKDSITPERFAARAFFKAMHKPPAAIKKQNQLEF